MKNRILAFFAAICIAATAAERISGVDSLAIGNLAGKNGSANRTVVIGSGAGAYMTGGDSNLFVGAAAGLRTKNVKSSVGLGHYAMRGATNLTRCVGIGDLAFKEAKDLTGATWINGQFFAGDGRFFIRPNTSGNETNAPIYYANGTLYLNAQKVVTTDGGVISGGTGGSAGETFDFYVSTSGDDANEGRTTASAKRTIDAAWNAAKYGDRIAVLPGTYDSPAGMSVDMTWNTGSSVIVSNKSVDIIATAGPDYTFMDCGGVRTFVGDRYRIPTIKGFSVRNIGAKIYSSNYSTGSALVCFEDCRMAWTNEFDHYHSNCGMAWCIFTNCDIFASMVVSNFVGGQGYDNTFMGCDIFDCRVKMAPVDGNPYKFGQGNCVRSSFIELEGAKEIGFWMLDCLSPIGTTTTWENCTLIASNCTFSAGGSPKVTWRDCLVVAVPEEIGTWESYKLERTLIVDVADAAFGGDLRTTVAHPSWRYYGYGSELDRAQRDALVAYLIEAGYITAP